MHSDFLFPEFESDTHGGLSVANTECLDGIGPVSFLASALTLERLDPLLSIPGPRTPMDDTEIRRRALARFAATALGVVVAGVAGYVGFVAFVVSDREAAAGVLVLAAGTGFAAFFSPCSFPLLLTFLTRRSEESKGTATLSSLRVAGGAAILLAIITSVVAAGGSGLARVIEFDSATGRLFRFAVGLMLVVFGLRQANVMRLRMRWLDTVARASSRLLDPTNVQSRTGRDLVYGFGYLLAGFG